MLHKMSDKDKKMNLENSNFWVWGYQNKKTMSYSFKCFTIHIDGHIFNSIFF